MAVVMEVITRTGAKVIVRDDAYINASPEEIARRRKEISDTINRVADNIERQAAAKLRQSAQ